MKVIRPSTCHPERKAYALGLCNACYQRQRYAVNPSARERAITGAKARYQGAREAIIARQSEHNRKHRRPVPPRYGKTPFTKEELARWELAHRPVDRGRAYVPIVDDAKDAQDRERRLKSQDKFTRALERARIRHEERSGRWLEPDLQRRERHKGHLWFDREGVVQQWQPVVKWRGQGHV